MVEQILGKLLGHTLGKCRHQHALVALTALLNLFHQVINLILRRTHLNFRIKESRRTDELLHDDTLSLAKLIVGRCGTDIYYLIDETVELVKFQRTVVESGRQTETILYEVLLPRPVTTIHRTYLRHTDMALVDNHEVVFREEIQQAVGALSGLAAVEVAAVVLYARAVTELLYHLDIIFHTLLDALGLYGIANLLEVVDLLYEVVLNVADGRLGLLLRRNEEVGRINLIFLKRFNPMKINRIDFLYAVNLIVPPTDPQHIVAVGHCYVDRLTLHAEIAALQVNIITDIEGIDKTAQKLVAVYLLSPLQFYDTRLHGHGTAHTIYTRHRRYHNDILPPRQKSRDGREPQTVDLVVDGKVLFYISVGRGQISLRLIVVVVRYVVFNSIIGEETFHLLKELRGQSLVVAEDKRRLVDIGNDIGHSERLSRSCHAKKHLTLVAIEDTVGKFLDSFRLVARRFIL